MIFFIQTAFIAPRLARLSTRRYSHSDATARRLQFSVFVDISFRFELAVILSLFAEWSLAGDFFNLVLFKPFPSTAGLLSQVCLLLLTEELFRGWMYKFPATWTPMRGGRYAEDAASVLAAEYMIPKATLGLGMLELGAASLSNMSCTALHFSAVVMWTGIRQLRVFETKSIWSGLWESRPGKLVL